MEGGQRWGGGTAATARIFTRHGNDGGNGSGGDNDDGDSDSGNTMA